VAASWNVSKDSSLYGNVNQLDVSPVWGSYACGPTSAVNSFVYLERKYGYVYDRKLVPDTDNGGDYDVSEMISVATILGGDGYMHTITDIGTYAEAPGVTLYNAQSSWGWTHAPVPQPDWYQTNTNPTKNFLYNELLKCADVEIDLQGGANHYLTVYSFNWTDTGNGTIDNGECTIGYINPWGGVSGSCDLWEETVDGKIRMTTNYAGGSWIGAAFSEVPEPTTLLLLGLGSLMLLRRRRG
jgi:hypothetical protein